VILGDTNSGLSAIAAARRRIPVYHIEAGNRCFDDRVPEELNRRLIDQCSTVLLPYTQRSKDNLIREGFERERIFVVGNPIFEVLSTNSVRISASDILSRLGLVPKSYVLITAHRAENVDHPERLRALLKGLTQLATETGLKLVWPVHPRTADKLRKAAMPTHETPLLTLPPLGFFDFVRLEGQAACVVTDSGTVQEECAILRVPNVTVRDVTERPETVEAGSNIVAGVEPEAVVRAVNIARALPTDWQVPFEYLTPHASTAIAKVVLGMTSIRNHAG
jgi:UDP-N-acetylglucosamine 2-epimerase (non-hydrolysing)